MLFMWFLIELHQCMNNLGQDPKIWVVIKRGTGNEEMGNRKYGNEEMNWKWSSLILIYKTVVGKQRHSQLF